jgi:hypothetical protein
MVRIPSQESAGPESTGADPGDPLRRAVHVALAIYLMPVVVIVCAIGGISIVFDRASKLAARFRDETTRQGAKPSHLPVTGSGSRLSVPRDRRRIRVGR